MKNVTLALLLFTMAPFTALADAPSSFAVRTTSGKLVQVSPADLSMAYGQMVAATTNNQFKNDDGSTSFNNPSVMVAGEAHIVSLIGGSDFNYAVGFCTLKGFGSLVSAEGNGDPGNGPFLLLNTDGSVQKTFEGPIGNLYPYRSITCR